MNRTKTYSFGKIPTLSTVYWSIDKLKQSWKWSDRSMESVIQRFIELNQKNLSYLGISANIENLNGKSSIKLITSKFIGAIPIISPLNGKAVGDLIVSGRFGEEAGELITLLDNNIRPEYSDKLRLAQDTQLTPPIFMECCKYIDTYIKAEHFRWQKFSNVIKIEQFPQGSTIWDEYALRTAKNPLEFSTFHNKRNLLTIDHPEWAQLNYVLKIAIDELESQRAPIRIRAIYSNRIDQLKKILNDKPIIPIKNIQKRMSDPCIIKRLKDLAIIILGNKSNERLAWRMDYAEFFEKYVQYLLEDVTKRKGAHGINNPHYPIRTGNLPQWGLHYLEPDLILIKNQDQIIIDAKYKSHIFNWHDNSDILKEAFRHDFHQILAYCALNSSLTKQAMLVYPFSVVTSHKLTVNNPITHSEVDIYLIGIPIGKKYIDEIKEVFNNLINFNN